MGRTSAICLPSRPTWRCTRAEATSPLPWHLWHLCPSTPNTPAPPALSPPPPCVSQVEDDPTGGKYAGSSSGVLGGAPNKLEAHVNFHVRGWLVGGVVVGWWFEGVVDFFCFPHGPSCGFQRLSKAKKLWKPLLRLK